MANINKESSAEKDARIQRLRQIRARRKENRREKKIAQIAQDPLLNKLLKEIDTNFTKAGFSVFSEVLQPKSSNLKNDFLAVNRDLTETLLSIYPSINVQLFGSAVTGLAFHGSDFDFYIAIGGSFDNDARKLQNVYRQLNSSQKFKNVFRIPKARTPLVKVTHKQTNIKCDINVSNCLGVYNSEFLHFALMFDPRIKPLAILVKYWSRVHNIGGTNSISSYALTMLTIFYLQQLKDPIFPPIFLLQQNREPVYINGWNMYFDNNFKNTTRNNQSIIELLGGFFDYYSKLAFEEVVLCPYYGRTFQRTHFPPTNTPEFEHYFCIANKYNKLPIKTDTPICIQDPFEQNINFATPINASVLKRFRLFASHAFELVKEFKNSKEQNLNHLKDIFASPPTLSSPINDNRLIIDTNKLTSSNRNICILTPMNAEMIEIDKLMQALCVEVPTKKFWSVITSEIIKMMLEVIFLIQVVECEGNSKNNECILLKNLNLKITSDSWSNRKKVQFTNQENFEKELILSKTLQKSNKITECEFQFTIMTTRELESIEIELSPKEPANCVLSTLLFQEIILKHTRSMIKSTLQSFNFKKDFLNLDIDNIMDKTLNLMKK